MPQTATALRCYAGVLSLLAACTPQKHFFLGSHACKLYANKTLNLQAVILEGFWQGAYQALELLCATHSIAANSFDVLGQIRRVKREGPQKEGRLTGG